MPTLKTDLRSTQRVIELLRLRRTESFGSRTRSFSNRPHLLDTAGPRTGNSASNGRKQASDSSTKFTSFSFRTAQLGSEIENWINQLSKHGKSLHVWDTISKQDENGTWKLLPQVEKDLQVVDQLAKNQNGATDLPFTIKIADGRIKALTNQEIRHEQESGVHSGIEHGSFISATVVNGQHVNEVPQVDELTGSEIRENQFQTAHLEGHGKQLADNITSTTAEQVKFHGSAAARRQRAQRSRDRQPAFTLPRWFTTHNVSLKGMGKLDPAVATSVQVFQDEELQAKKSFSIRSPPERSVTDALDVAGLSVKDGPKDEADAKEQNLSVGGDSELPPGGAGDSTAASNSAGQSSILISLSDKNSRYYIDEAQHNELIMTAKGRLKLPTSGSMGTRPGGIRDHLMIHYAAQDGDFFLDSLLEDMAKRLQCNLVSLDAQDISDLILRAEVDIAIQHEAAMLGYEVYGEIYKDDTHGKEALQPHPEDDAEDGNDEESASMPQAMPFMIGKPITIDLKALFSSKPHRRSSSGRPSKLLPDIISTSNASKFAPPLFAGIVDSVLSSAQKRQSEPDKGNKEKASASKRPNTDDNDDSAGDPTIIHIKELKIIQETNVGKQFLAQLYEQVERRRAHGESIMLVGTECSRDERFTYDHAKIEALQSSDQEEISSPLVITPINQDRRLDMASDRTKKLKSINARHLWQMLRSKNLNLKVFGQGPQTTGFAETLHAADQSYLEKGLWSYSYVQRIGAILASSDFVQSKHPIAESAAIVDLSDRSKLSWAKQGQPAARISDNGTQTPERDRIARIRRKATKHEKRLLNGVVEPGKIRTTFKDIHIPAETVEALQTLTTLSLVRPDAFNYGVLATDRIPGLLLYGPPGTGKTMAAKAVARESGATMLEVSAADINDMYVGEGEKNVKALFSLARKLSPCVVFLDEADAMFSARSAQGRRVSHRELLNQFLKEWDGMSNDSASAFIMVATNRPMDLDDAVLRRLPRRLLVDLPTETDRLEILKIHLRNEKLADDVNLSQLATKTPFYSGSDLKNVAVAAALNAVRDENELARHHTDDKPFEYPERRILTARHFERSLEEISASISEDMASLREIKKFDEQYGDKRGRKRKSPKWGFKTTAEADAILDTIKVRS